MLRARETEGQETDDPFMPLPTNIPDFDDGINIGNLDDSTMSEWLDNFSANGGVPDELLSVTELLGLSGSGLIGGSAESDHDLRSPEKFQDLKFTSTPKGKTILDSGFADETVANKSIEYKVVLNDITDKLAGNIFTSLTDVCESSGNLHVSFQDDAMKTPVKKPVRPDENKGQAVVDIQDRIWERNVPIIRRRIRSMPISISNQQLMATPSSSTSLQHIAETSSYSGDSKRLKRKKKPSGPLFPTASIVPSTSVKSEQSTCSKCREPLADPTETEIGEAELMYYTGIKKHKSALGIIKFMRLPDCSELSTFKRIFITIMKLRFDFPYEDLGFRLRKSATLVKQVIGSTVEVMGAALVDFLPWSEPPTAKCASSQRRCFYLTELKHSEMKVIVLIEDKSNLPICYVSELFDPTSEAMDIAMATCSQHFVDGDLVCFPDSDAGAIRKATFYKVTVTQSGVSFNLAGGKLNEGPVRAFLTRNAALVSELSAYLATDISRMKNNCEIPIDVGIRICSALVNVNYLPENNLLSYFQQVFSRSSQATLSRRVAK